MIFLGSALNSRKFVFTPAIWLAALLVLGGCGSDEDRLADFMEQGKDYVAAGDTEEAVIEFKNVLQIDPNYAPAHEALSLAYLEAAKPREAYWEMSETVRLDPSNIEARLRYGTVSSAFREFEIAGEQADAILEIDPTRSQAFMLRAQSRVGQEDLEGAEADYLSAIKNEPTGPAYRFLYAGFLERQGRNDEVVEQLRELNKIEDSYLSVSTLGRHLAIRPGDDVEAEALLRRSIELAEEIPDEDTSEENKTVSQDTVSLKRVVPRDKAIVGAYTALASYYYERDQFDEAIAILEAGAEKNEHSTALIYQMAKLYGAKGMKEKADETILRASNVATGNAEPKLVLSAYLGLQGDIPGALEAAEAAVAIEPDNQTAQLRVAELLVDLGYRDDNKEFTERGRAIVDSVLEAAPSKPEAQFVLAKIQMASGDVAAAKQSLVTALETRPDWPQARFVLGSALAVSGELARARVELARAVELSPTMSEARKLLTQVHARLREDEFAIEQGRAYLQQNPGDSAIRIIVGQSLIRVGRAKEAREEIQKIPEADWNAPVYFALGQLEVAFGHSEKGKEYLLKAEELSPGSTAVLRALLGIDRKANNVAESAARIRAAAKRAPDDSELVELTAEVAAVEKNLDGAKAALLEAVELDPTNISAQLALADLERVMGNIPGMVSVLEHASLAMPDSSDLHYRLGLVYEQAGNQAGAVSEYEEAIGLNDNLVQAKNNLAYLLSEMPDGDLDRALELAQQAKARMPDDPNAADTLGWILLRRGVPSAAIGYLEEAMEHYSEQSLEVRGIVGNHLAEAYEKNEESAKAVEASKQVIANYEKALAEAKKRGVETSEPEWARVARARIERLGGAEG